MEPSSLNSSRDGDAALTTLFRTHVPSIPDDGFSARVLSALPPPEAAVVRSHRVRWPWAAYIGGSLAGATFAVSRAGSWPDFITGVSQLTNALVVVVSTLSEPWLVLALILSALSLVIALPFTQSRGRPW
jgi:hypothetical protein